MGVRVIENQRAEGELKMNFLDQITGRDMRRDFKHLETRAKKLPIDYQAAWQKINTELWSRSDFTGRNILPILEGVLGLLEEAAHDGQSIQEVLGGDIKGFCSALAGDEGALCFRDKWRKQLNDSINHKLH
jgi:DNA-binding ferritin-like protein (Dps family)